MRHLPVIILLLCISHGLCFIEEIEIPPYLKNCLIMKTKKQTVLESPSESICNTCLTRYMWMDGPNLMKCNQKDNTTIEEITKFVGKILCDEMKGKRHKRQARNKPQRKEYRVLKPNERQRFHNAMNRAYEKGYYGWVAKFHNQQVRFTAHGGPNFFGYHRLLCLILEKILQYFDPTVALPYWNSALDSNLDVPEYSIIWSKDYLGNGNGAVRTGPFAGWTDSNGNIITRNVGMGGSLFTEDEIKQIINMPTIYALSEPSPRATLESLHDDVHNYVGGTMLPLELAPWDPVFWLHHCFCDYLWEVWRYNHGYNTEYPIFQSVPNHHPNAPMKNMPYINFFRRKPLNRDGYSALLARQSYYQLSPTCTRENTHCSSSDLQCRVDRQTPVCCGVDRRYRRQTQPLHDARNFPNVNINNHIGRRKRDTSYGFTFKSEDIDRIYIPREREPCMGRPVQNNFIADCSSDVKNWAFIPIKVVHLRPNEVQFASSSEKHGAYGKYDMYDEHKYHNLHKFVHPDNPATYQDCREDESGAFKVRLKSVGISYFGQYVDYVFVDNRLPISSHIGYIGVQKPTDYKITKAFVTASDACGRLCKPTCAKKVGNVVNYVPCTGAIKVNTQGPLMYGNDFGEAVLSIWHFYGNHAPIEQDSNIFMVFYCDYSNTWPWPECNKNKG